ncbi:MAG: PD-(D/E)XK nuclease domain-containing protein [Clostridiales bacterium]|jgi:hypothetical protein|nr:PD-(D/E)XK nuclease domain-containing protein [Clostridiales bacterium]
MLLIGLLADFDIESNYKIGNGRTDIILKNGDSAVILELKPSCAKIYFVADALKGIMQIRDELFAKELEDKGFSVIQCGISFFKKECKVVFGNQITNELIAVALGDMETALWAINLETVKRKADDKEQQLWELKPSRRHIIRKAELDALMISLEKESRDHDFYLLFAYTESYMTGRTKR